MGAVKACLSTDSTESPLLPLSNFIIHLAAGERLLNNEWLLVMGYISLPLTGHINRCDSLGPTGSRGLLWDNILLIWVSFKPPGSKFWLDCSKRLCNYRLRFAIVMTFLHFAYLYSFNQINSISAIKINSSSPPSHQLWSATKNLE